MAISCVQVEPQHLAVGEISRGRNHGRLRRITLCRSTDPGSTRERHSDDSPRVFSSHAGEVRPMRLSVLIVSIILIAGCATQAPVPATQDPQRSIGPSQAAVASLAPASAVVPTSSPTPVPNPLPSSEPSTSSTPGIHCGTVEEGPCQTVVGVATGGHVTDYASVNVEPYMPPCLRADLCAPPWGGYEESHVVIATDATGNRRGWVCKYVPDGATTCRDAMPDEIWPLAALKITLVGVRRQYIFMRHDGSGWSWTARDQQTRWLTTGSWLLATTEAPCVGCQRITPPFTGSPPPHWCSLTLVVQPSDVVTIALRIRPDGPCSISRVP